MEFDLNDDQALFLESSRRFLQQECPRTRVRELAASPTGFDHDLWSQACRLGWTALLVHPELGGAALSPDQVVDASIVAELVGTALFPGPVLSTMVAAHVVATVGTEEQRRELLPCMLAGSSVVSWCPPTIDASWSFPSAVRAMKRSSDVVIDGVCEFIECAHIADQLVVKVDMDGRPALLIVETSTPGLAIHQLDGLDVTRRLCDVAFDGVVVPASSLLSEPARTGYSISRELEAAVTLNCAEAIGAADVVFTETLEYAKQRVAFGRAIGSYQAIKHRFADMALALEACKGVCEAAARVALDPTPPAASTVSAAKSYVGDQSRMIVSDCQQITGGIAMTWEYDQHLYLRRVVANRSLLGSPAQHRERICLLAQEEGAGG